MNCSHRGDSSTSLWCGLATPSWPGFQSCWLMCGRRALSWRCCCSPVSSRSIQPYMRRARVDGAGGWAQFWSITLPLLRPAILVAVIFRTLDAFRVFDLIYVLTAGGPGTVTEPIALYTHTVLLQYLRFGFGSAMSVIIFLITFGLALVYIRLVGVDAAGAER